jgi:hypothetical protein
MFQPGSSFLTKNGIGPVLMLIGLSRMYRRRCHGGEQNKDWGGKFMLWETTKSRSSRGVGNEDERMGGARTPEGREGEASYRRSNGPGEKGGDLNSAEREPFSASFWSLVETRGITV